MADAWFPKDKVCIVGIGETAYTRWGRATKSEFHLALEAVVNACRDAGLDPKELDGFCSFSDDRNQPVKMAAALGCKELKISSMFWGGGGGGGSGAVMNACLAVATGSADYVVAFRSLAQGQFGRFGQSRAGGRVGGDAAFTAPWGQLSAPHTFAMRTRRHMHQYGTTSQQMGRVSVASYRNAQRNPRAVMHGRPITLEDHQTSRMIVDPFHLYDCCLETDGAAAVILTTPERARNLKQLPIYVMAASQGNPYKGGAAAFTGPDIASANFQDGVAKNLYARAGVGPQDIDVAQIYENFTGMVIMSLEEHGFCKRGEGGPFVESGIIDWPNGKLPINTSGGNLAEAYTHGFELVNEAVRQLRGASTCQVKGAEICLVASGPGVSPVSDLIVRR
jgi:acetyl-CoA acetyltransferase